MHSREQVAYALPWWTRMHPDLVTIHTSPREYCEIDSESNRFQRKCTQCNHPSAANLACTFFKLLLLLFLAVFCFLFFACTMWGHGKSWSSAVWVGETGGSGKNVGEKREHICVAHRHVLLQRYKNKRYMCMYMDCSDLSIYLLLLLLLLLLLFAYPRQCRLPINNYCNPQIRLCWS